VDAHDFGGRENASHIVLVGAQEFAMALRRLSANQPVKMVVDWKGRRATLTEKLFIDIATSFLTAHVAIDTTCSACQGDYPHYYARWQISSPLRRRSSVLQFLRLATANPYGPK